MAKQKPFSTLEHPANLIWFKDLNIARPTGDYGKLDELVASLTEQGWKLDGDGTITGEKLPETLIERAIKQRQERWDALKEAAKMSTEKLVDLAVFEELYILNGKVRIPTIQAISGNRRSEAFFLAMVARKKANPPLPLVTEIPVIIREFSTPLERLDEQLRENLEKTLGYRAPSALDNLLAAKVAVELGARQTDLRKRFKDGMGQKLWGLIQLNKLFPTLRIIERIRLPINDPEYINFGPINHSGLSALLSRADSENLTKLNKEAAAAGKPLLTQTTVEEVSNYLSSPREKNEKKVMKGETIRGLAENFPVLPIREMAKAIVADDTSALAAYHVAAKGFNALDELIRMGDYPPVELILCKILSVKNGQRVEMIKRIIEAIG